MSERPILFSAPMVRAILSGTKTQTRRIVQHPTLHRLLGILERPQHSANGERRAKAWFAATADENTSFEVTLPCKQGDILYVRETFSGHYSHRDAPPRTWPDDAPIWYWADGNPVFGDWTKPKPGIHMPRWASRITLRVFGVRVQRLQDISEADAVAEGMAGRPNDAVACFSELWETIHGKGAWALNPWVCAITFQRSAA